MSEGDQTIDTIVPIGVMGSGKSSLSCIMALKDNQQTVPDKTSQPFPVGAGEKAMTEDVCFHVVSPGTSITDGRKLKIIDSPGLDQDEDEDVEHIKKFVSSIKEKTPYIKLFPIVLNSQTRTEQQCIIDTIRIFEEIFGTNFWLHACLCVTHFSQSKDQQDIRRSQKMTEEKKKENIMKVIHDNFPASKGRELPVFFTDAFDLGKHWDTTREAAKAIAKTAQNNQQYDTKLMRRCTCINWREQRERILSLHGEMQQDEVISSLGEDERATFVTDSAEVITCLRDEDKAVELTQKDFDQIEEALQAAKDRAIEANTKRLEDEREAAEKERKVQEELAEREKERREIETKRAEDEKKQRLIETARADAEQKKASNARIVAGVTFAAGSAILLASGGCKAGYKQCRKCCR